MSFSAIPKWTLLDTDGAPIVGGTFEFFEAGTSTPKNVYSDTARSASLGDTVTTDSRGEVGPLFLDTAEASKAVAKDDLGNTLWTIDNLTAPTGSVDISGVSHTVSPLDYGAVGDGAADESTEVQSAIDAVTGTVDLAGKTYRCDSALTLPSTGNITIRDGVIDARQSVAGSVFSLSGSIASLDLLTAIADAGDSSISIADTASYSVGDWILVQSNDAWGSSATRGEICRVKSLTSTVITIDGQLRMEHSTANGASVRRYTMASNVHLSNVRVLCAYASTQIGLDARYVSDIVIDGCSFDDVNDEAIRLRDSVACTVRGSTFLGSGTGVQVGPSSLGCSVESSTLSDCASGVSVGNVGDGSGLSEDTVVSGCTFSGGTYGVYVDELCHGTNVVDCASNGPQTGFETHGVGTTVRACKCYSPVAAGVGVVCAVSPTVTTAGGNAVPYALIDGCYVEASEDNGITVDSEVGATADTVGVSIVNCRIAAPSNDGIECTFLGGTISGLSVIDTVIDGVDAVKRAININNTSGNTVEGIDISGVRSNGELRIGAAVSGEISDINIARCAFADGVTLDLCDRVSISDTIVNDSSSALTYGFRLTDCNDASIRGCRSIGSGTGFSVENTTAVDTENLDISGCYAEATSGGYVVTASSTGELLSASLMNNKYRPFGTPTDLYGMSLDEITGLVLSGNDIETNDSSADAIVLNRTDSVVCCNNTLKTARYGVSMVTALSDNGVISNNVITANGSGTTGINLEAANGLLGGTILGNLIKGFATGIDMDGAGDVCVVGNYILSVTTAIANLPASDSYGVTSSTSADFKNAVVTP